jgi:hypothetical protein
METIFEIKSTSDQFYPLKLLRCSTAMAARASSFIPRERPKDEWQMLTFVKQFEVFADPKKPLSTAHEYKIVSPV